MGQDHLAPRQGGQWDIMTEPPALRVVPDEEVSGLWLWHGAPPDQQQRQRVPRRGVRRLSSAAALIVATLSALATFVLIVPRLTEPAGTSASSAATVAIATPTPPPAVDTPTSPPSPAADTPASKAAGAGTDASPPASAGTPARMPAEPPARDRAGPALSRAFAAAPRGVSSQESHPVVAKPGVVRHHRDPRFARQTGTSLSDLLATPAFRDGTLRPVQDPRVPHIVGAVRAGGPAPRQRADQLPPDQRKPVPGAYGAQLLTKRGVFGTAQGHANRHLAIDPKNGALYVGVGSSGNIGVEPEPKATIQRFDADGANQTTVASGTRNPTALAFQPETGDLWAVVQERDGLGDNLPSDYLIRVQQGGFYGWPYAYIGKHPQPGFAQLAPDKVEATITPDLLFTAHSSLLDLVFYEGGQFPAQYKGSLFVALKGSWNRSLPTGYKLVLVPFKAGRPEGWYENFATGFWVSGERRAEVWGRPAALAVAKDGALLVADDTGGTIWRISYKSTAEHAATPAEEAGSALKTEAAGR
jgi:glucose/sorbosone dehydrogenase